MSVLAVVYFADNRAFSFVLGAIPVADFQILYSIFQIPVSVPDATNEPRPMGADDAWPDVFDVDAGEQVVCVFACHPSGDPP